MAGGGQERGKRPTTESLELVTGFAEALSIAQEGREVRSKSAAEIRDYLFDRIAKEFPEAVINGSRTERLPNNANISLPHISDPEFAVIQLDKEGIACSTKSSCLKGEEQSYVVAAITGKEGEAWRAKNTLRFSFDPRMAKKQAEDIVRALSNVPKAD